METTSYSYDDSAERTIFFLESLPEVRQQTRKALKIFNKEA